ncbi:MAG: hypothetical protein AAGF99_11980 [Bacteroidota bacterium]
MSTRRSLPVYLIALSLSLLLPFAACDTVDPTPTTSQPTSTPGGSGGDGAGENEEGGGENEGGELEEGEIGGAFRVEVEPVSTLLGGITTEMTGSAVFFSDSESGRTVLILAEDDVLEATYPFEFVVLSTPDGLPAPGTYPLSLDTESSYMGGFVDLRGDGLVEVTLPFQEETFELPPSSILQTFSGELVVAASSADEIEGTLAFKGFPVDSEFPPLYVLGETNVTGTFRAVSVSEEDAPDIDIDLYLPDEFEIP